MIVRLRIELNRSGLQLKQLTNILVLLYFWKSIICSSLNIIFISCNLRLFSVNEEKETESNVFNRSQYQCNYEINIFHISIIMKLNVSWIENENLWMKIKKRLINQRNTLNLIELRIVWSIFDNFCKISCSNIFLF
jgi:hypothetical protein